LRLIITANKKETAFYYLFNGVMAGTTIRTDNFFGKAILVNALSMQQTTDEESRFNKTLQ